MTRQELRVTTQALQQSKNLLAKYERQMALPAESHLEQARQSNITRTKGHIAKLEALLYGGAV